MKGRLYSAWALIYLWVSAADEPDPPSSTRMAVGGAVAYAVFLFALAGLFYWATK